MDLVTKTSELPPEERRSVLVDALLSRLAAEGDVSVEEVDYMRKQMSTHTRRKLDVLVLSVIEAEFTAALSAFGLGPATQNDEATLVDPSNRFFLRTTELQGIRGKKISVAVGMIGRARNVNCSNYCRTIMSAFDVDVGILVGIAAGVQTEVELGDVVGGTSVFDFEGGSVTGEGRVKPEPKEYPLSPRIQNLFDGFNPVRHPCWERRGSCLEELERWGESFKPDVKDRTPKYKPGVILSGEKVRRDNVGALLKDNLHRKISAVEMEGSGFAAACDVMNVRWAIFRGISDFGDGDKNDDWHSSAALNAALTARCFIERQLRFGPLDTEF